MSNVKKKLIAFYSEWDDPEAWKEVFRKEGFELKIWPKEIKNKKDIRYALIWDAPSKIWKSLPKLILLHSLGAGVDHILKKNPPKHLKIAKLVDKNLIIQLAEYSTMAVLLCQRGIHNYINLKNIKKWKQYNFNKVSSELTILLLGYGDIGQMIYKKLRYLGYKVIGWKKNKLSSIHNKINLYYEESGLIKALSQSDIVISTLPSTSETYNIINE